MLPPITLTVVNKKHRQTALRQQALEKENLRLQRKIATLEAKLVSARNELLLRPPFSEPRKDLSVEALNKWVKDLPSQDGGGGTNAA